MQEKEWGEFYKNDLDVLDLLKAELDFLEKGGHRNSARTPWLPDSTFRDSPICINFGDPGRNHPCDECLLMELVPSARRAEKIPCLHIPVTQEGKTVDELGRSKTQKEIEIEIMNWLRRMIATLEGVRGIPSP
jgi:hypothetical protein